MMFEVYKLLLAERENDSKRLWVLFGLMNVINGALLAFVATKTVEPTSIKPILASLGLIVSIFWFAVALRMTEWIKWWESKLEVLEAEAFEEARASGTLIPEGFKVFQGRKLTSNKGLSTKWVSYSLPGLFLFSWLIILAKHAGCI